MSSGEYFKWAAYDDVLAPEFLKKCVNVLDKDNSIIGCHCKTGRIDQNGNFLGYYNQGLLEKIDSPKAHERFRDLIGLYYTTTPFHGVYRRDLFAKSQLHGKYIGADRNLVAELSLWAEFIKFLNAYSTGENTQALIQRILWHSPKKYNGKSSCRTNLVVEGKWYVLSTLDKLR